MSAIEEGRRKLPEQEEIGESCREIFITAIDLLKTNGQLSDGDVFINRYQVFQYSVDNPRQEAIIVKIVAGADLTKARTVSMYVNGVGRLDVIKTGVKGQEKYRAREFSEYWDNTQELNGSRSFHILDVRGYLRNIRRVNNDINTSVSLKSF